MLENYLDIITNMDNYVDAIIVLDKDANLIFIRHYTSWLSPLNEKEVLGKNLFEIYPNLNPQESTILKALQTGESTINYKNVLTKDGKSFEIYDDTFAIRENGKIIGAVCITHTPTHWNAQSALNISNVTATVQKELFTVADIIGRSEQIVSLREQISRTAQTNSSVLIYGETGTGKELAAQSIHTASSRKNKPFITQNCAAIPATLLESIFFGTVKGSYTGAEDRKGIFETADGGTVFLDEINSMDIGLQAKLLRVLEEKKVTPVGGIHSKPVDIRILAALNQSPVECVKKGTLRADLFYRLGSVTINIPPLRERVEDIDLLTEYYIAEYSRQMKKSLIGVSQDVMGVFYKYSWPGNVREFKNVIEGAFNLCDTPLIGLGDLPSYILSSMQEDVVNIVSENQSSDSNLPWLGSLKKNMEAYEKSLIIRAVSEHRNLSSAAEYLGISRQSLNQKMNKYHLTLGRQAIEEPAPK